MFAAPILLLAHPAFRARKVRMALMALATPVGTMRGSYQMVAEDGASFDAPIPEFTLSMPRVLH